jgi:hypothetical protein
MSTIEPPPYALVECRVVSHQRWGLVIRSADGTRGYIDRGDVTDGPIRAEEWPAVGAHLTCVVVAHRRDGRFQGSARPRDIALVSAVDDPRAALEAWRAIRDDTSAGPGERARFFASPDAAALLRWALRHPAGSPHRTRAAEILADAPEDLVRDVGDDQGPS